MSDSCCTTAAPRVHDIPFLVRAANECPECGSRAKSVPGQTVKAILSVSLRQVREGEYFFCRTPACAVVYFSADGAQTFTINDVRERVYQKEPDAAEVFVCYCFRHTVGEVHAATPERQDTILADINAGINMEQCACDLRNPQGTCCLGNVRQVILQAHLQTAMVLEEGS